MSDKELLELAARAAGLTSVGWAGLWNPLEEDGDALWLAVKLRLDIHFEDQPGWVGVLT